MIYLRLREWIKYDETKKLSPVVAFLLAATSDPFKGESHDLMAKVLKHAEVTTHFRSSGSVKATLAPAPSIILLAWHDFGYASAIYSFSSSSV